MCAAVKGDKMTRTAAEVVYEWEEGKTNDIGQLISAINYYIATEVTPGEIEWAKPKFIDRAGLFTSADFPCPYCGQPSYLFKQGGGKSTGRHIRFTHTTGGDDCLAQPAAAKLDAPHAQGGQRKFTLPETGDEASFTFSGKVVSLTEHFVTLETSDRRQHTFSVAEFAYMERAAPQPETVEVGQGRHYSIDASRENFVRGYERGVEAERERLTDLLLDAIHRIEALSLDLQNSKHPDFDPVCGQRILGCAVLMREAIRSGASSDKGTT